MINFIRKYIQPPDLNTSLSQLFRGIFILMILILLAIYLGVTYKPNSKENLLYIPDQTQYITTKGMRYSADKVLFNSNGKTYAVFCQNIPQLCHQGYGRKWMGRQVTFIRVRSGGKTFKTTGIVKHGIFEDIHSQKVIHITLSANEINQRIKEESWLNYIIYIILIITIVWLCILILNIYFLIKKGNYCGN